MKKTVAIIMCLVLAIAFAGCSKVDESSYEAMTGAAIGGNYADALNYYENGGADSGNADVLNWYYYSMAMNDYTSDGCLGYSYDLLVNKCSNAFSPADGKAEELLSLMKSFDGAYSCGRYYLYIDDGKIAVGDYTQLTGTVYCTDELVLKNGTYYMAKHSVDGEDTLLYTLTLSDSGITVTAVDDANNMYAGEYTPITCEFPELVF